MEIFQNTENKVCLENFSLAQICQSGQCFRMEKIREHVYSVIAGGRYLEIEQEGAQSIFHCGKEEYENFWKSYFDIERDYGAYVRQIDTGDAYLTAAAAFGSGIRILRQDLWEMIVTFLISQQNNIARIRRCVSNICEKYGERRESAEGIVYYTFPTPEALAGLGEDALMECNLGYRSKYVVRSAKSVLSGELDLDALYKMSYPEAKETLLGLYGVGNKVADCVCLFALHHLQAVPVDTHILQAFSRHYPAGFPDVLYDGYQGVLQQYIFYYELFGGDSSSAFAL
ncbi:MAG: 8-oxoguanine DNA glycosylase [Ruminococcus sp.]|nr:8-oxoguanine DNA glycosylase [Ruminococcus sp.]